MISLTKEELQSQGEGKVCYICGIRLLKKLSKYIIYRKVRDHYHYTGEYIVAQRIVFLI